MAETRPTCPKCGAELPSDGLGGHCPKCLGQVVFGLSSAIIETGPSIETAGARIGRYKLLQRIGEGGFGIVWMAEQEEPVRRRVALKIIKLGMDTRQVVARFEAERQALALMDHPNIAQVYDGGATEDGRPYFVMELVKGVPIMTYCDTHRLSTCQRLELFLDVCHAVQHAHQKGIIHRDLKPSNILVTEQDGRAVPKVIDFGVAKATEARLTEKTLFTQLQQVIGTPAYMSPEQAGLGSLDVDTRSDIYSLGVLLYESLTGRTPFDTHRLLQEGYEAVLRTIREVDPLKPSTRLSTLSAAELSAVAAQRQAEPAKLSRLLRGDLDWIVMKALEKDRKRRYETANALASDVVHHLEDQPVSARPPSPVYRARKFIRRHQGAVGAVAAVIAVLLLGILLTWRQARRAEAGERTAQRNLYAADMLLAGQALRENNVGRVVQLLDKYNPVTQLADLRGWEWRYFWGQTRTDALFEFEDRHAKKSILTLAASPDGRWLASGGADSSVKVWDVRARRCVATLPHSDLVYSVAFSVEGRLATSDRTAVVRIWDPASLFTTSTLLTNPTPVWGGVAFARDGRTLAVAGWQDAVRRWTVGAWQQVTPVPITNAYDLTFSPSGQVLAAGQIASAPGSVVLWNLAKNALLATFPGRPYTGTGLSFSPDGQRLAVAYPTESFRPVTVWDVPTRQAVASLTNRYWVVAVGFAQDGRTLATGGGDQSLRLYDTGTWQEIGGLRGSRTEITTVVSSPTQHLLMTGDKDGCLRIYPSTPPARSPTEVKLPTDLRVGRLSANGRAFVTIYTNGVADVRDTGTLEAGPRWPMPMTNWWSAAIAPDGRLLACAGRKRLLVFDTVARGITAEFPDFESGGSYKLADCSGLAFSADGKKLAAAATDDTVSIIDLATRSIETTLRCGFKSDPTLAFSPDGGLLAVNLGRSGSVAVWDIGRQSCRAHLRGHRGAIIGIVFFPDGDTLATASWDNTVRIWSISRQTNTTTLGRIVSSFDSIALSPDGRRLAAGSGDGTVKMWDTETWQEVATLKEHPGAAAVDHCSSANR